MAYVIYLIRHAKTLSNLERRYLGLTDESLTEAGIRELREKMQEGYYPEVERVYVSPMLRCRQTAELIYPDSPLTVMPGFSEYDFGEFEGKRYEDLKHNTVYRKWVKGRFAGRAPGGEDLESFTNRCCSAFAEVLAKIRNSSIEKTALVVHGGTIMAILQRYIPGQKNFYDWQVPNCEGYKLVVAKEGTRFTVSSLDGCNNAK